MIRTLPVTDALVHPMPDARMHFFSLLFPPPRASRARRWLAAGFLLVAAATGLASLRIHVASLSAPWVHMKDFLQEYILARAVVEGLNPYLPGHVLAARYIPETLEYAPWHPVPHGPFLALLVAPLGLVSYEVASAIWLGLQLVLLLAIVCCVAAASRAGWSPLRILLAFSILLFWMPVQHDLFFGQLTIFLAALVYASWAAHWAGRRRLAGVLLGVAIAIKAFPILIAGYFLLKREWQVIRWTAATLVVTSVLAVVVLGTEAVRAFVFEGLPGAASHRAAPGNYSLVGAIWHIFAGNGNYPALIPLPGIVEPLSLVASLAVVALAARAVHRASDPELEFGIVLSAMILASPLAWQFYFVLLLWPLWVVARRLYREGWPRRRTNVFLLALLTLTLPGLQIVNLASALGAALSGDPLARPFPVLAGIPILALVVGPGLLYWIALGELRRSRSQRDGFDPSAETARVARP